MYRISCVSPWVRKSRRYYRREELVVHNSEQRHDGGDAGGISTDFVESLLRDILWSKERAREPGVYIISNAQLQWTWVLLGLKVSINVKNWYRQPSDR